MDNKNKFRVGDAVVVKPGVMCPDNPTVSLAGWQGWVKELYTEERTLELTWDSQTLRSIPDDYIRKCEIEGLGWESMVLGMDELASATPRGTPQQAQTAYEEVAERHAWDHMADTNPGIKAVLGPLGTTDVYACLGAWRNHLTKALRFPFEAEVCEMISAMGPYRVGDKVLVEGVADGDDHYGLQAHVSLGKRRLAIPLCDLEATKKSSPNYQPLKDYVVWFANQ